MEHNNKSNKSIRDDNYKVFALLSHYLNNAPDYIQKEDIEELLKFDVTEEYAFAATLAAAFGLDIVDHNQDQNLFNTYFSKMFHKLDVTEYRQNPYYQNIKIPSLKIGNSELKYEKYKPYEGFVCNDIIETEEGRQIPQIGFFDTEFRFPAITENQRIWMTITPNEIETMKEPIEKAFGHVLTYGLGLGYYTYMVSEKENVDRITVVEMNEHVIRLFKKHILPQFTHPQKVKIIKADAFQFAQTNMHKGNFNFIFTDLWHDVSDGIDLYLKMKTYEKLNPNAQYMYWIEKSIRCYL